MLTVFCDFLFGDTIVFMITTVCLVGIRATLKASYPLLHPSVLTIYLVVNPLKVEGVTTRVLSHPSLITLKSFFFFFFFFFF